MLRYSCLIIGILLVLIILLGLVTCRTTGFPVSMSGDTNSVITMESLQRD